MTPATSAIILFVKQPVAGQVKTRLGAQIGLAAAAEAYRLLAERVIDRLPREIPVRVCFAPADAETSIRTWLESRVAPGAIFQPQCEGDLGTRMAGAFHDVFAARCQRVAIIGSDCIEIDSDFFAQAFAELEHADVVIGPSEDGGYYLLALKRDIPELFRDIAWSTERTLRETITRIESLGLTHASLPMRQDVDTAEEWREAQPLLAASPPG